MDARLKPFLEDNKEVGTRRATHIELVSYAHPRRANLYHHGVVMVAHDQRGRMIDDARHDDGGPFTMRGSDLGAPCPNHCGKFELLMTGMPIPNCPRNDHRSDE